MIGKLVKSVLTSLSNDHNARGKPELSRLRRELSKLRARFSSILQRLRLDGVAWGSCGGTS